MQKVFPKDLVFSMDLESTGLHHELGQPYMTQIAIVPVYISKRQILKDEGIELLVKCPPISELQDAGKISKFVLAHPKLKEVVEKASTTGLEIEEVKKTISAFLNSYRVKEKSKNSKAIFLGKSVAGLDRRLMGEVFGDDWLDANVHYRMIDTTSNIFLLQHTQFSEYPDLESIEKLLGFQEADHTALQDAIDTAEQYFKILDLIQKEGSPEELPS